MADLYQYPYNYSNGTSVNGTGEFIQYISTLTNDFFAPVLIFIIWLSVFGFSLLAGSKKAITVASFVSFILSIYFVRLNMISPVITIGLLIVTIVGAILSRGE